MKRFLLWVVGVILGVAVLLGAVMTVSYSFTGEGARPAADTQFGGQALEVNGSCWQVPLLGGVFDKVFTSPETLTVQKLGVLYDAHPALALPDWASYTTPDHRDRHRQHRVCWVSLSVRGLSLPCQRGLQGKADGPAAAAGLSCHPV